MIRQSLVEERVSALHHHALQASGETDVDMSKATSRRVPAPVGSRIIIKKNASLLPTGDDVTTNSPSTTPSPTPTVDPRSRVELLERNLRYIQQQHEITLTDLHREISRLQEENRDLHFSMINLRPNSPKEEKQTKNEIVPTIKQFTDITLKEPVLEPVKSETDEKRLYEVQRLHFEQQIDELQQRIIETEEKNEYLMRTLDQMNQLAIKQVQSASSPDAGPVLLPDPSPLVSTAMGNTNDANQSLLDKIENISMNELEYQRLLSTAHDKQRHQLQEIAKLRAVLREILHGERLSSTSKLLIRDVLANSHLGESTVQQSTAPLNVSFSTGQDQGQHTRMIGSSSSGSKPMSFRQASGANRPHDQRLVLPPIQQSANFTTIQDSMDSNSLLHSSMSQANSGLIQQKNQLKFGETTVARRERRTQELQRTRLTRNLYH